jgi:hypothetical protein
VADGCLKCGGPLTKPARGPTPTYCSEGCKLAARYERQRLQRRLETLETGLANLRALGPGVTGPAYLASLEAQIEQAEARLLVLLGGGNPEPSAVGHG